MVTALGKVTVSGAVTARCRTGPLLRVNRFSRSGHPQSGSVTRRGVASIAVA
jgi:hypothetical protein